MTLQSLKRMTLSCSRLVHQFALETFQPQEVEELWCIALNSLCHIIDSHMIARGTVNACFAHPRDIFRFAISANAVCIVLVHNHPSGDIRPSQEDRQLTLLVRRAGELLQIPLVDHVIVSPLSYFSFADSKWAHLRLLEPEP